MDRVLHQRRNEGGLTGQLHKLLGLEQKMRQYEVGERFVRAAVDRGGTRCHRPGMGESRSSPDARRARRRRRSGWPVSTAFPLRAEHLLAAVRRPPRRARRRRRHRSWSGAPGAPTRLRCSRSCAQPVTRRARCTSTTVCVRTRSTTTSSKPRPRGSVPASDGSPSRSTPGGNLEARARGRAVRRARAGRGRGRRRDRRRRAHARRPGRDGALERVAGERHDRPRRHAGGARLDPSPVARVPPGRDPRDLRAVCGSHRCTTR